MRVLICGDRKYDNPTFIKFLLNGLDDDTVVINGGAWGADFYARKVGAEIFGAENVETYYAEWTKYPQETKWMAGHVRNQRMLDEGKPDVVFAFKDNFNWGLDKGGTEHMVKIAKEAGVPTYVIQKVQQ